MELLNLPIMKITKSNFPQESVLTVTDYDYFDSFKTIINDSTNTIDSSHVAKAFMSSAPSWVDGLFALRNKIVGVFGLKTGPQLTSKEEVLNSFEGNPGESLGFFKVFEKTENEIILGEDDSHLDFRVSLLLEPNTDLTKVLTITTTVKFKNAFGRIYFFPVKPFHRLIVPVMLKGIAKELNK
jgi:hypothetical protein